jgi:endonuclease/exonuclease/phosphatase family metal-dependent hydrolase
MLTYNVHGLLPFITGDDTEARMRAISPRLNAYDIAAIQENFFFSEQLLGEVNHASQHHFGEALPGRGTGSGLSLLSTFAIEQAEGTPWSTCHGGFNDCASDCLGSKGVQWARVRLADHPHASIDVYNLHMEAGGCPEDLVSRDAQTDQLLEAISERSPRRAVIVVGDTNLRPSDPFEDELLGRIRAGASLQDACTVLDCPEPDRIDRFLLRGGEDLDLLAVEWHQAMEFFDAEGAPLSDHDALAARFEFRTR